MLTGVRDRSSWQLYIYHQVTLIWPHPTNGQSGNKGFKLFCKATGLSEVEEARQVSTLLYCLGEDAASIMMNISAVDARIYSKVLDKLDSIFEARKITLEGPHEVLSK